jgi:hypothetical protein
MQQADSNELPRQQLLVVTAMLLEAMAEPGAVAVLATLKPADMRPGGARVPGTSYELDAGQAARVMRELLAVRGGRADALLAALADADIAARRAMLAGTGPPRLASLYPHCIGAGLAGTAGDSFEAALKRLYQAADRIFTLTQMRRIDAQCFEWKERSELLDSVPVQQFVARWVRNTP